MGGKELLREIVRQILHHAGEREMALRLGLESWTGAEVKKTLRKLGQDKTVWLNRDLYVESEELMAAAQTLKRPVPKDLAAYFGQEKAETPVPVERLLELKKLMALSDADHRRLIKENVLLPGGIPLENRIGAWTLNHPSVPLLVDLKCYMEGEKKLFPEGGRSLVEDCGATAIGMHQQLNDKAYDRALGDGTLSRSPLVFLFTACLAQHYLDAGGRRALLETLLRCVFADVSRETLDAVCTIPHVTGITVFAVLDLLSVEEGEKREKLRAHYTRWLQHAGWGGALRTSEEAAEEAAMKQAEREEEIALLFRQYVCALWEKHRYLERRDTYTMDQPPMEKLFVRQTFRQEGEAQDSYPTLRRRRDAAGNLRSFCRMIVGPTGMGKTSFLRNVILSLVWQDLPELEEETAAVFRRNGEELFAAEDRTILPLFVRGLMFGRQKDLMAKNGEIEPETLMRLAWGTAMWDSDGLGSEELYEDTVDLEMPQPLLEEFVRRAEEGTLLLIVDAYDEAADRQLLERYLHAFRKTYQKASILITSRPTGTKPAKLRYSRWSIGFGRAQQEELICRWCSKNAEAIHHSKEQLTCGEREEYDRRIRHLEENHLARYFCANPYLLTAYLASTNQDSSRKIGRILTNLETSILQKVITDDALIENGIMERMRAYNVSVARLREAFCEIAFEAVTGRQERVENISEATVRRVILKLYNLDAGSSWESYQKLFLASGGGQSEGEAVWQTMRTFFTTQPGILVAGEEEGFCFLSELFLCHMAAQRVIALLQNNTETAPKEYLDQIMGRLGDIESSHHYALVCVALLCAAEDLKVSRYASSDCFVTRQELLSAVVGQMTVRLAGETRFAHRLILAGGLCDILADRFASSLLNSMVVEQPLREVQTVLLLNALTCVPEILERRKDAVEQGTLLTREEILNSTAARSAAEQLREHGYILP